MRKVMVFGSFDPLHDGHRSLFRQARRFGDFLTVVVARDSSIRRIKQREPQTDEERRRAIIEEEQLVDEAVLGRKDDFFSIVHEHQPDVLVLGYDQETFTEDEILRRVAPLEPVIKRAIPLRPERLKSSKLRGE